MDLEELRHRTVFWTAETGACGTEASAMSEGCGGESSPRDVDWMTAFVVAVRAQTEEETAETAESSDPQQCIDSLARLLITRPFPVLLTRYDTVDGPVAHWLREDTPHATEPPDSPLLGAALNMASKSSAEPLSVKEREWLSQWRLHSLCRERAVAEAESDTDRARAIEAGIRKICMTLKMKEAQIILFVLLECLRIYKLNPDACLLPTVSAIVENEDAVDNRDDDTDNETMASARYARKKKKRRGAKQQGNAAAGVIATERIGGGASKRAKASEESESVAASSSSASDYIKAIVQVFDRIMIWDSLFFLSLENNNDAVVGIQFQAFMQDCVSKYFAADIRNVVESLFIKAGMKLEPLPISSPILTAAPPQQVRRHSTRTHRRPNTMSTNTDTATKASVLRRMARASSALTAASILPGNKSDSPSASPTLTLSTSSQSSIVSESVSAVPASVAIPIKRTRSCMSTLSNRYVNLSQPKAAALSASEKAKQVLAKKMKASAAANMTSGTAETVGSTGVAVEVCGSKSAISAIAGAGVPDCRSGEGVTEKDQEVFEAPSTPSRVTRTVSSLHQRLLAAAAEPDEVTKSTSLSLVASTKTTATSRSSRSLSSAPTKQSAKELARIKSKEAKAAKEAKAVELMSKRMSGGNGIAGAFGHISRANMPLLSRTKSALEVQKEKLKNDLKMTDRLRGCDLKTSKPDLSNTTEGNAAADNSQALVGDSQTSQASAISVDMDAASAVSNINNTTPVKKIPRTPSSARHSRVRKLLPSGKKIASAMKNMNWDDLEASCMSQLDFVSDSPIKDVAQERPAVKLKVRSARKRIAARMLDVDSLLL